MVSVLLSVADPSVKKTLAAQSGLDGGGGRNHRIGRLRMNGDDAECGNAKENFHVKTCCKISLFQFQVGI